MAVDHSLRAHERIGFGHVLRRSLASFSLLALAAALVGSIALTIRNASPQPVESVRMLSAFFEAPVWVLWGILALLPTLVACSIVAAVCGSLASLFFGAVPERMRPLALALVAAASAVGALALIMESSTALAIEAGHLDASIIPGLVAGYVLGFAVVLAVLIPVCRSYVLKVEPLKKTRRSGIMASTRSTSVGADARQ